MEERPFDVIVVGAGIEGSATAYQLGKRGVRTLLLEQFPLPHSRGSSHGQTRITRKAYKQPYYTDMMNYATPEWERVQRASGQTIFKKCGFLAIGQSEGTGLKETAKSMAANGAAHHVLTPEAFRQKYPNMTFAPDVGGVLDPEGGILMADKCLRAFQTLFVKQGGVIHDGEPVVKIDPGQEVRVTTNKNRYRAKALVLCCGPWTNKVIKPLNLTLPLQPVRISVCYWPEIKPGTHGPDKFPCFFERYTSNGQDVYGLPSEEYPGSVKVCYHDGPKIDPDRRDTVDDQWPLEVVRKYVKDHFPGLRPEPSVVEACIYTNTPDEDLILDRHPAWKNIIIGAGFSGHGFKLSPAVGKILADLAMNKTPDHDIQPFRIDRFNRKAKL